MHTKSDHGRLALAPTKFDPVARVLERLSTDLKQEYGRSAVLKPRGLMQQTAGNICEVQYALHNPQKTDLSLTFMVVGDNADLLLLKRQEQSGPDDNRADPGQVDQRVYRLGELETIRAAVREKIIDHLRARGCPATGRPQLAHHRGCRVGLAQARQFGRRRGLPRMGFLVSLPVARVPLSRNKCLLT
jgi:hypothetical protein